MDVRDKKYVGGSGAVYTPLGSGRVVYELPDGTVLVQFPHGGGKVFHRSEVFDPRKPATGDAAVKAIEIMLDDPFSV